MPALASHPMKPSVTYLVRIGSTRVGVAAFVANVVISPAVALAPVLLMPPKNSVL